MYLCIVNVNTPGRWFVDTIDHLQQRGFSAPRRAEQYDKLTRMDVNRDLIHGGTSVLPIELRDVLESDRAAATLLGARWARR